VKDRSPDSGGWASFESVLDEFERPADEAEEPTPLESALGAAFATFAPPVDFGRHGLAAADRWEHVLDWIADPPESAGRPAAALNVDPEAIAAELGLSRATSRDDLKRARRRFMWENHPDRRPDAPPELANRRVAIANMLIDRAEQALRTRST
jgi:hypothetical protein